MKFYTNQAPGEINKEIYISRFYEEGDYLVRVKEGSWLQHTGDDEVFFTSSDNIIYVEGEENEKI